ncbi:MAG TPA: PIN domain-containing protein [Polyangia bacterium]|nr:PIN domain-containing protein [Polyangia bacterium]
MILVDTSAWIAFFRDRGSVAAIVVRTLEDDEAALCGPVLAELRRGFVSAAERSRTIPLLRACHQLSQPASLWNEAGDLGFALARKGVTVKSLDLLIAAYALTHDIPILTLDRDFQLIARAGVGLHLVDF